MTDNRTTELREKLDALGVEHYDTEHMTEWHDVMGLKWNYFSDGEYTDLTLETPWEGCTPEQAIAATLGSEPPYDELLRCLENDWHISASWDGLRKFWCIELTEEGVKLRDATHGTLTAEQVREAIEANSWAETSTIREFNDSSWQAIADELNAELGSGKAKDLLLRTFGLAQMMHDCWLEECKAGDNVDVSACNAYSYEFDQIVQAMFDMGIDPNDSDYYRSAELGSGTCENENTDGYGFRFECSECGYSAIVHNCAVRLDELPNFCPSCGRRVVSEC